MKRVIMPKAILRILKDIKDQDTFRRIINSNDQWKFQEIDENLENMKKYSISSIY